MPNSTPPRACCSIPTRWSAAARSGYGLASLRASPRAATVSIFVVDFEAERIAGLAVARTCASRCCRAATPRATLALASLSRRGGRPRACRRSASPISSTRVAAAWRDAADRAILSYHGFFDSEPERLSRIGYRLTPVLSRRRARHRRGLAVAARQISSRVSTSAAARPTTIPNPAAPEPFPAPVDAAALARADADHRRARPARRRTRISSRCCARSRNFATAMRGWSFSAKAPSARGSRAEVAALGVAARVDMPGFTANVATALASARCLALSSRRESLQPRLRRSSRAWPAGRRHRLRRAARDPRRAGLGRMRAGRRHRSVRRSARRVARRSRRSRGAASAARAISPSKPRSSATTR